MIGDPAAAPPRSDLPFLRRRSRPRPAPATDSAHRAQPAPAVPAGTRIDYSHPGRRHDQATPAPVSQPEPAGSAAAPPSTGPSASPLDLSSPPRAAQPPQPAPPAPPPAASPLDLSSSERPAPAPAAPTPARRSRAVRVSGQIQHLLTRASPTVTLTRVQSGVGHLDIDAIVGADVGDLRLGAAYQLRSGTSSLIALSLGRRFAPPGSRRPVLAAGRERGSEHLVVDLRQIREIERVGVLAFAESRAPLRWGGTLVVSTVGGARIELPLESLHPGTSAMLMSLYNVDGELVIRAEMETIAGDVREAARAYGYDRITWRDERNPVD